MQPAAPSAASETAALLHPATSSSTNDKPGHARQRTAFKVWCHAVAETIWQSGALCMSIASLVFSISGLLVKLVHVPTFEIVVVRSGLSFAACAFGAHQARLGPLFGHKENLLALLGRGSFGAAAMSTYYMSIAALPLADAVTLFFMNPAVTALAAWLILKEPLGWIGAGGIVLSLIGLVMQTQPPAIFHANSQSWDHQRSVGTGFGLLSAMCAAGAFICIRIIGKREPALVMSVFFHTCAFVSSALPLAAGIPDKAVLPSWRDAALLLGIASTSFWGQILIGRSFQLLSAAKASAINFSQVVYSYIFGILLLGESISVWGVVGSLLIAAGVLLVNMRPKLPAPSSGNAAAGQAAEGKAAAPAAAALESPAAAGGQQPGVRAARLRDSARDWAGDEEAGAAKCAGGEQESQWLLEQDPARSEATAAPENVQPQDRGAQPPVIELQPAGQQSIQGVEGHGSSVQLLVVQQEEQDAGQLDSQPHPFLHSSIASQPSLVQPPGPSSHQQGSGVVGSEPFMIGRPSSKTERHVGWADSVAGSAPGDSPQPWQSVLRLLGHMDTRVRVPQESMRRVQDGDHDDDDKPPD